MNHAAGYLENQVLSATPVGLVCLLYEGAIDALRQARVHLEAGRIPERSEAINKAMQIVLELQGSLDLERGGEIARALAELYAYTQERLAEANARQQLRPLEEALALLSVVYDGWKDAALEPPPHAVSLEGVAIESAAGWVL